MVRYRKPCLVVCMLRSLHTPHAPRRQRLLEVDTREGYARDYSIAGPSPLLAL